MQTNVTESRLVLDQEWKRANNKVQQTLVRVEAILTIFIMIVLQVYTHAKTYQTV